MQRINLIPPEFAIGEKALIETGLRRRGILIGILLITILAVHYGMNRVALINLNLQTSALERRLTEATALSEAVTKSKEAIGVQSENLEKRMNSLMGRQMLLEKLESKQFRWSEALAGFHQSIPDKIWVDELTLDEHISQVSGGTFSNEFVGAFIDGLNRSTYFTNATFVKTEAATINNQAVINYELTFELIKGNRV
jgi:Tfp pilus assembly protein PilN